jgi:hypothetical protein
MQSSVFDENRELVFSCGSICWMGEKPKKKDPVAVALAKKRLKAQTPERRSEIAREGASARWKNATEEERAAHGQMLAEARARKRAQTGGKKRR